jgi:GNAT superfamily N-acetyltransferase
VSSAPPPAYSFEALADHDRASFYSGVPELDDYLRLRASQHARRRVAAAFGMVDQEHRILCYYTLSAYSVRVTELPPDIARKLPKYPLIPATLLGRLAVSREYQGRKLGRLLLMDALYRSWKNSAQVASLEVVAEAIDEAARTFYLHHEFTPLPQHPGKLLLPMQTIARAFS